MSYELTSDSGILSAVKEGLGFGSCTDKDDFLTALIQGVIEIFNTHTNRSFAEKKKFTYERFIDRGELIDKITLPYAPIASITSIQSQDGLIIYSQTDQDFKIDSEAGIIIFSGYLTQRMMLKIIGKYGGDDIPADVGIAILTQTLLIYDKRNSMGLRGSSGGDGSVTYTEQLKILEMNQGLIDKYRLI